MSRGSQRPNAFLELAPHQLTNEIYSAQGSISPFLIPSPTYPVDLDSVKYPAVSGQFQAYYETPRVMGAASNSIGIYGGYKDFQSLEGNVPAPCTQLPYLGKPMPTATPLNYLGCSMK